MSLEDPEQIEKLASQFNIFLKGIIAIPLNFPGTRFYDAMRAANAIRKQLVMIAKQRRVALEQRTASPSQDLLSYLLVSADENGRFLTEMEITNNILTLLFAGHDTSSVTIALLIKYLGEMPQIYEAVLRGFLPKIGFFNGVWLVLLNVPSAARIQRVPTISSLRATSLAVFGSKFLSTVW
uniref:Uncharacterized protein n=1 Tax=Davidia involucrata TaxID=16924 RepID=A0A5B7C6Y2_DAVIN